VRRATVGERFAKAYSRAIVALRLPVLVAWVVALAAAIAFLPALGGSGGAPLDDIVPADSEALKVQEQALELFGSTLATDMIVVQRNPDGLSRDELEALAGPPLLISEKIELPQLRGVKAAVPLVNVPLPGVSWNETSTTALTYLFMAPDLNLKERFATANRYARSSGELRPGTTRGVTGAGPGRLAQFDAIEGVLPIVTGVTLLLIIVIVSLYFRSWGAPLITLATAAVAYVIAVRVLAWSGERAGVTAPSEIEPVLVVLLLGLVTDYTVFFLSETRRALLEGRPKLEAARLATARIAPIVLTAGVLVAGCAASLLAGESQFFRVFGPGLAVSALIVTFVCVTLVPALMALFGPRLFGRSVREAQLAAATPDTAPGAVAIGSTSRGESPGRARWRMRMAGPLGALRASRRAAHAEGGWVASRLLFRLISGRVAGGLLALLCVAGLALAATGASKTDLTLSFIPSLPKDDPVRVTADRAAQGFNPGVLAPTDVLIEEGGLENKASELGELQRRLMREPGVDTVIGPAQAPEERLRRLVVTEDGTAARFMVFLEDEPTGSDAIATLHRLQDRLPVLARRAGLSDATAFSYGGETALAADTVDAMIADLKRVAVAAAIVTFLLLALFLRALVAPLLLLLGSLLAFAGSFGLTALLLPDTIGGSDFVHYVPLVAAVLLVGLGSDYNVFIAGRIREEMRTRRLREAIAVGAPSASRAITIAGITLAASFAVLALVPLRPFRELALLMTIGVLIDAMLVRPVLIPALLAAAGRFAWWPWPPTRRIEGEHFLEDVAQRTGRPLEEAGVVALATLTTLAERLPEKEVEEMAHHLPEELAAGLEVEKDRCSAFGAKEFIDRVAERTGLPREAARGDAEGVLAALADTLPAEELDYIRAALSSDYRPLLGDARSVTREQPAVPTA
jgi:RND superfamily putative drug exporter